MGRKKKTNKKNNKKRIVKLVLVLTIILIMSISALTIEQGIYLDQADQLYSLSLLKGTGKGYELDREPTRLEGLVMLIRLVGKEDEALRMSNHPSAFSDIPDWATGYANYANEIGLVNGVGDNLFGSDKNLSAQNYVTFMLKALEYNDRDGGFSYEKSISFANEIGLLSDDDVKEITSQPFLRDHLVKISMLALKANLKGENTSLLERLVIDGAITKPYTTATTIGKESNLEVHFIDVGQADSILIKKGNKFMLIDAGNNSDGELVVNYLKEQNVSKLNYVIGTHPHEDHIGGLDDVINYFEIEKVLMPNVISTTNAFEDVLDSISNKGLSIIRPKVGATYDLNGATATILAPNQNEYDNFNNYSIVIKVTNGDNSYLLTGDAEVYSEKEMLKENGYLLKADVLKLGHHGSSTSSSLEFLDAVDPDFVVISVGVNNKYGHPSEETLVRLSDRGISVLRTDLQGTIVSISNGKTISFGSKTTSQTEILVPSKEDNILNAIKKGLDKIKEILTIKDKLKESLIF